MGNKGENIACDFLKAQGLEIIARNYKNRIGEIDIICREAGILVFIEVKTKTSDELGTPEEMVGIKKQQKLKNITQYYLAENEIESDYRIDVVSVNFCHNSPEINWIKSAVEDF